MSTEALAIKDRKDDIWDQIRSEAEQDAAAEPMLASFLHAMILNHNSLESALSFLLAHKLDNATAPAMIMREIIEDALINHPRISQSIRCDLRAVRERDSACDQYSTPFLYFKGFHALQAYRISHGLWQQNRKALALFMQNRISGKFTVDIHPAAQIGHGIMLDHATGIVIGETAIVGNNVSIMQEVTLGGTGKDELDRHPKVGNGVLISCGAKILGNIKIGEGAKIGAGSVVLEDVPAHTTVAGVPAVVVGRPSEEEPALAMDHSIDCPSDH